MKNPPARHVNSSHRRLSSHRVPLEEPVDAIIPSSNRAKYSMRTNWPLFLLRSSEEPRSYSKYMQNTVGMVPWGSADSSRCVLFAAGVVAGFRYALLAGALFGIIGRLFALLLGVAKTSGWGQTARVPS